MLLFGELAVRRSIVAALLIAFACLAWPSFVRAEGLGEDAARSAAQPGEPTAATAR